MKRDRDFDTIIKQCQQFAKAVEATREAAKLLKKEAAVAAATLKDDVSQKNIAKVDNLSETILKKTATGLERVRELEKKTRDAKEHYDHLRDQGR